jgi:hypothetical protein
VRLRDDAKVILQTRTCRQTSRCISSLEYVAISTGAPAISTVCHCGSQEKLVKTQDGSACFRCPGSPVCVQLLKPHLLQADEGSPSNMIQCGRGQSSSSTNGLTDASGPLSRNCALLARSLSFLIYHLASHIRLLVPRLMLTFFLPSLVLLAGSGTSY